VQHRALEIHWLPSSQSQWETFTASRKEAGRLWNDLTVRHKIIRRLRWKWPSKSRWEKWAARRYPLLHSQSVQQIVGEFLEAVRSATELRKKGHPEARYPWRRTLYHDVIYSNQAAVIRDGKVILPNGKSGKLKVSLPPNLELPGRLVEARLTYGRILIVCQVPDQESQPGPIVGVDLGVNTLIAATDGKKTILVSGREAKATVQWRNKNLASIQAKQASKTKRSRRHLRLQRRKYRMLDKSRNRIRDITHKAMRKVADAFPNAKIYVGEPFNDAAQKLGRKQAQQVSSACNRKIIAQLDYKTSGVDEVPEPFSSQTCPVCGRRNKCRRIYKCQQCLFTVPRDVVGSSNIRTIGRVGKLQSNPAFKIPKILWMHPSKYSSQKLGSSGGTPANSSVVKRLPRSLS
jgi:putative transposase